MSAGRGARWSACIACHSLVRPAARKNRSFPGCWAATDALGASRHVRFRSLDRWSVTPDIKLKKARRMPLCRTARTSRSGARAGSRVGSTLRPGAQSSIDARTSPMIDGASTRMARRHGRPP